LRQIYQRLKTKQRDAKAAKGCFQVGQTAKARSGSRVQSLPEGTWPPSIDALALPRQRARLSLRNQSSKFRIDDALAAQRLSAGLGALKGAVLCRLETASVLCFQRLTAISNNFAAD
jgi:hypothetical protein